MEGWGCDLNSTWSGLKDSGTYRAAALCWVFLKALVLFSLRMVSMQSLLRVAAMQDICSLILRQRGRGAEGWFCNRLAGLSGNALDDELWVKTEKVGGGEQLMLN